MSNSVKRIDLESYFGDSANVSLAKTSLLYNENVISTKDVEKALWRIHFSWMSVLL